MKWIAGTLAIVLILGACTAPMPPKMVTTTLPEDENRPFSVSLTAPDSWTSGYAFVAKAQVVGGAGPVTYAWSASGAVDLDRSQDGPTAYAYCIREGEGTISLTVTRGVVVATITHAVKVK